MRVTSPSVKCFHHNPKTHTRITQGKTDFFQKAAKCFNGKENLTELLGGNQSLQIFEYITEYYIFLQNEVDKEQKTVNQPNIRLAVD